VAGASEVLSRSLDVETSLEAMLDVVTAGLGAGCLLYLPEGPSQPRRLLWRGRRYSSHELDAPTAALEELLASEPVTAVLCGVSSYQRLAGARLSGLPGKDQEVLVVALAWHKEVLLHLVHVPRGVWGRAP
jgi:hypothetical protein